jgi:hypothetical protein
MWLVILATSKHSQAVGDDEPFSSPLFRELVTRIDPASRHVILEPGQFSPGILNLLQGKRCRILVADATVALSVLSGESQHEGALLHQVEKLITGPGCEKVDTVLCWDLLNYLSRPLLKAFTERLSAIMSPSGMLHAYIFNAQNTMPKYPQRYSVMGDDLVVRLGSDPAERETPRYSYGDLGKNLSGLRVARSILLRNGIQEYLLSANPD